MMLSFAVVTTLLILIGASKQIKADKRPNIVLLFPDEWRFGICCILLSIANTKIINLYT